MRARVLLGTKLYTSLLPVISAGKRRLSAQQTGPLSTIKAYHAIRLLSRSGPKIHRVPARKNKETSTRDRICFS